jgi:exodeoxyribonuclease VII small subunit
MASKSVSETSPNDTPASEATDDKTFEESVLRLETIVTSLENGRLSLEDSLKAYEEGLGLARTCLERLDQAELKVRQLAAIDEPGEES